MKLSILLASYNGEKYISRQITTILDQLSPNDELIISDDGSTDKTLEIANSFNDTRISILKGPREGINANFIYHMKMPLEKQFLIKMIFGCQAELNFIEIN